MKNFKYILIGFLSLVLLWLSFAKDFLPTEAQVTSKDAIAVRVMPNNEHWPPLSWYQANIKNQGSPQALKVDGYEAVRDGRTVYVNAGNVSSASLFTNIYLMSYSQEAEAATEDIFGQLLSHWKFNINLSEDGKANARSDTKRLADLAEMNLALASFKSKHNGQAPALVSGSYLVGRSISRWPSWQATLGQELGVTLPTDPINQLADCPGYTDKNTCWDENNKTFYFNFSTNLSDTRSIANSAVYWYAEGAFHANLKNSY